MSLKTATVLKNKRKKRRAQHVRRGISRHSTLPRLSVNRTTKHMHVQVIDDVAGKTLASATTTAKSLQGELGGKTKSEKAAIIGRQIAEKAKAAGVEQVVFDRGCSKYHGRVKALADAAREGGLKF